MKFTIVECWITGTMPLLQNRATEEALTGKTRSNNPGAAEDPRDICERTIYRMPNKQIAVPGTAYARMIREAGGSHKAKGSRKSLKYLVPGSVIILDDLCGLYHPDRNTPITSFEVDARPVTIPATKGRVMRYRARFNSWASRFNLRINEQILDETMVRRLTIEGLQQIGVGDFRPEKGGPFGTADVTSWKVLND
jgi:hypothetical protein